MGGPMGGPMGVPNAMPVGGGRYPSGQLPPPPPQQQQQPGRAPMPMHAKGFMAGPVAGRGPPGTGGPAPIKVRTALRH
jgi:hypothetical protein